MKNHILRISFPLFCIVSTFSLASHADVVELRNGTVIEGFYLGGTQKNIRFQVGGDTRILPVSDVLAITFTGAPSPPITPAPQAAAQQTPAKSFLPEGTRILIRTDETLDSTKQKVGHRFMAHFEADVHIGNAVVIPRGSKVYGRLSQVKKSRRLRGKSQLQVELLDVTINGQLKPLVTSDYSAVSDATGRSTLRRTARGAAIGGLIDGSDGAAAGAKVGAGISILTKGERVVIPKGTLLEFRLAAPFMP